MKTDLGTIKNPILLNDWFVLHSDDRFEVKPGVQLCGVVCDHHEDHLKHSMYIDFSGNLRIDTSTVQEVLDNDVVKTVNTYYKLGAHATDTIISSFKE